MWRYSCTNFLYFDLYLNTAYTHHTTFTSLNCWIEAWFRVQFGKKHVRVSFSKTIKIARVRRTSATWGLWKLTSACFSKLHEKPCYYLVIIYMTKLCRIEAYVYVTQNNLFTSDCQYFYNEKTFVRMTEIKQCVLNTKKC